MAGGKSIWVEAEENETGPTTVAKGGHKSASAIKVNGKQAQLIGKVLPKIAKKRGTF